MPRLATFQKELKLTDAELEQFKKIKITNLQTFLKSKSLMISKHSDLSANDFTELKQSLLNKYKTDATCVGKWRESSDATIANNVDLIVKDGQLIELRGDSGTGKSQLALWAVANVLAQKQHAMIIDAANGLCAERIVEMLQLCTKDQQVQSYSSIVSRLHVCCATNLDELIETLQSVSCQATFGNLRLLVIDSLNGAMTAQILSYRCGSNHELALRSIESLVKSINRLFQSQSGPFSMMVTNSTRNVFGNLWANRVDRRLWHYRCESSDERFKLIMESSFGQKTYFQFIINDQSIDLKPLEVDQVNDDNAAVAADATDADANADDHVHGGDSHRKRFKSK